MNQPSDYEFRQYRQQMDGVNSASLTDRQTARAEWLDALQTSPELIAERVDWLIDGSYGYVSYWHAQNIIHNKRMNQTAALGQMIAALEWQCPENFARDAWNKLSKEQQAKITAALKDVITDALERENE